MLKMYLKVGCNMLNMDSGVILRLEGDTFQQHTSFPNNPTEANGILPEEAIYQDILSHRKTISQHHIASSNVALLAPVALSTQVKCYIGTPIYVDNKLWGILFFFCQQEREQAFSETDIEFIEMLAQGIGSTITNQHSQQQKQIAEERYRLIFENIDSPILIYDVNSYEIVDVNPTASEFYGYSYEEFLELTMLDINMLPQNDIEAGIANSQAAKMPYTRFPHRLKLGDIREVEDYSNEIQIDNRKLRFSIIYDYSERHAAEEALKRSEANLRAIFDNASQLMFLVDDMGSIIAMNRAATQMIRLMSGDPVQDDDTIHKFHPKSDRYLVSDYINRALEGHSTTHDTLIMLSNDKPLYINYRYVPVKTPDNTVIGVCVTGQDITSLKLSEKELARERNILRTLIDNLPDSIYIKDKDARVLTANRRFLEVAKVNSTQEILGKTDKDIFSRYGQQYHDDDLKVLRDGDTVNKDEPVILPDDSQGIHATTKVPLKNADGHIIGLVGVGHDITKQRAIEQGLRDNEQKFNQLITHIPETFWIYDLQAKGMIYASEDYEAMFGVTLAERQKDINLFLNQVHAEDREQILKGMQRQEDGQASNYEARFLDKRQGVRWVNIRTYPITNDKGEVYRVAGIASDITQQKQAQQNKLDMMAQQERISILSTFLRDASHEFKTPLSVINSSLYILKKTDKPAARQQQIETIQEQVWGISELVEMLVLMSRLDSGAELTFMPLNVNSVLNQIETKLRETYPDRKDDFKIRIDNTVPPVLGHLNYITQAVNNLVDNAVRYSSFGNPIYLRTSHDNKHVIIEVQDHGTGISDDDLPQIFKRFYRSDEAHSTRGFGLGLPVVQSIAQRHGGEVEVETMEGHGSTFKILFPKIRVMKD